MTMRLCFKAYRRKDGSLMIYLNNDRKVSVGISTEKGFGPSMKLTSGQNKLIDAAKKVLEENGLPFPGNVENHEEEKVVCGPYTLMITDIAKLGGVSVESDGGYVFRDGKYVQCGEWFSVEE